MVSSDAILMPFHGLNSAAFHAEAIGMKTHNEIEQIRSMVRSIADSCALLVKKIADLSEQVEPHDGSAHRRDMLENLLASRPVDADALFGQLIVDPAGRTVTYRGATCCLGNTLVFRMIERLARRPNSFISFDRLIRDVWDGHARSDEAIRSVVKELRDRLRKNGMRRLASSIRGQRRAYALILKS